MRQYNSINKFMIILSVFLTTLVGHHSIAQNYPVQTTVATTGPYLNYLSYYGDQNNHLQITITNLSFNTPTLAVRLRLRIEGSGWELYTNPNATIGQPFLIEAGMPLTISGIDLLPYLQANNLINPDGVDLNNLPHGFTNICVDVINESAQQQVLSTNSCGFLPIQEYQPPQAFTPMCGEQLDTSSMFHVFTWTPPVPFPAGADIEVFYDFSIRHWIDPLNNSALGGNSILVYEELDLIAPTTQVSDFDVQWEMGGTYVWTVTARVESNGIPLTLINNNGVSAPCTFVYGEELSLSDQLADGLQIELFTQPSSQYKGKAWWTVTDNTPNQGLSTFDEFFVEFRRQPTGNEGYQVPWFPKTVTSFEHFLYQLEPSTTYEVRVSGVIGGVVGDPTPIKTFTTPDPRVYNCGESDLPYLPTTYTVLENATVGTQVQIGQFMMTMTEVNEIGGGHYAGKGTIPIAFLGGAKAKVRFDDILIDTEYRVHEGRVDVVTKGLENWLNEQYSAFIDPYYVDGVVDSAWVDTLAGVAWVTVDGVDTSFTFNPPTQPIIVNDENGNQYTIYPNGTIIVGTYFAISENWAVMPDEVIHFSQNDGEARGFDGKEHTEWHENYEIMMLQDSSKYFVANKSLAKGEGDVVNVEIPAGASASFQFSDGTAVPSTSLQGNYIGTPQHIGSTKMTLNIPARSSSGNYSIYAMVGNQKVGQLNVKVYSKKDKEVIIVPIANISLTEAQIEAELDNTLGEANIDVDVTLDSVWVDTSGIFTASTNISLPDEVGLLLKYSQDMRDLRDAYFEQRPDAPKNKYYLFVVNGFDDPSELGYMVRGRSMGFVASSPQNILHTISHELGHGMGALEHTWNSNGPDQESTSSLMDYNGGDNLTIAEWKELRDLDIVPSIWDDAEEGSFVMTDLSFLEPLSNQNSYTFINPVGGIFSIPKTATQVQFSTLDRLLFESLDPTMPSTESNQLAPLGSVLSFDLNGENYAYKNGEYYKRNMLGQLLAIPSLKYNDSLTGIDQPSKAITSFISPNGDGLNVVYFHTDTATVANQQSGNWIIFDDGTKPHSSSLSSFVNHFKSSGSSALETTFNPVNFGADATPLYVFDSAADSLHPITPFTVFQSTNAAFSVEYLMKYLLLCNYKKNQFTHFATCVQDEMYLRVSPNIFHEVIEGCTTCVDLNRINYGTFKGQLEAHFQESITNAINTIDQTSYAELDSLVDYGSLEEVGDWLYGKSNCVTFGMPAGLRVKTFNKLITNDNYWNKALFLLQQIDETDPSGIAQVVNSIIDNSTDWLETLLPQLHDWEGDSEDFVMLRQIFDRFVALCGGQETNPRFAKSTFTKTIPNEINPLIYESTTLTYNTFQHPIFLAKDDFVKYFGGPSKDEVAFKANSNTPYEVYYEGGKVHVIQNYDIWDAQLGFYDPNYSAPKTTFHFHHVLNPYENITVQFLDNYGSELGFDGGQNIVVPAYYLVLMTETIDHAEWHANFRVVMDAATAVVETLAFVSAPLTAGGSLALVGAIVAATDIEVQQNRMNASTDELDAFETWDDFYTSIQLVTAAPATYTLFKSISSPGSFSRAITKFRSLRKKLNEMPGNINASLVYLRNAWNGTQVVTDPVSKLNTILAKNGFSGTGGIYEQLTNLSPSARRTADYASLQTFRDKFLTLHNANTTGIKSIDEVLEDFDNLVTNHYNVPEVVAYVDELMQSSAKFKGGAFGLEILNDLPPPLQGKTLTKFEAGIDDVGTAGTNCRFDMQFSDGTNLVYIETKNYAQSTAFSSSFYNQFKAYISNPGVTSLDQIKYYFRANNGVSISDRATKFQNMLLNGNKTQEIFSGMSESVRIELLGVANKDNFMIFMQKVNDTNSNLYQFIEVY